MPLSYLWRFGAPKCPRQCNKAGSFCAVCLFNTQYHWPLLTCRDGVYGNDRACCVDLVVCISVGGFVVLVWRYNRAFRPRSLGQSIPSLFFFNTNIHGPQRTRWTGFDDRVTFLLTPPGGWHFCFKTSRCDLWKCSESERERERLPGQNQPVDISVMWYAAQPAGYVTPPLLTLFSDPWPCYCILKMLCLNKMCTNFIRHLKEHLLCFLVQAEPECGLSLQRRGGNTTSSLTASPPSSAMSQVGRCRNKQECHRWRATASNVRLTLDFCLFPGEQARKFFLQSGLPPSVLAEIW